MLHRDSVLSRRFQNHSLFIIAYYARGSNTYTHETQGSLLTK